MTVSFFLYYFQDFRLLFHKCALLHSQSRMNEFLDAGIKMFRLFFIDVYYIKDLTGLWKIACLCFFSSLVFTKIGVRDAFNIYFIFCFWKTWPWSQVDSEGNWCKRKRWNRKSHGPAQVRYSSLSCLFSWHSCVSMEKFIMTTSLSHHASLFWRKRDSVIIVTLSCLHGGNVTL